MKTILSALVIVLVADAGCLADLPTPKDWMSKPKTGFTEEQQLPETRFAEVRITRLMTAVDRLKEKSAIPLSEEMAKYYAGVSFKAEKGFTPYLVRGLFANYTGQFSLCWKDGDLLVEHDSLGKHFVPEFCPLVVNLPSEPKRVFIVIGGAE
jgi:hypothetical protein